MRVLASLLSLALMSAPALADDAAGVAACEVYGNPACPRAAATDTTPTRTEGSAGYLSVTTTGALRVTAGELTVASLDVSVVATGGTAVTALTAGHIVRGGWLANPVGAPAPLCISEVGTAATSDGGGTTCIVAGQTYVLPATAAAVTVNSTASAHQFTGRGYR
jgi:hypothetical protein